MNLQGRLDKLERALPPSPVADPYDLPRVPRNPWQRSAAALPPSPVADPYDPSDILLMLSDPEACNLSCKAALDARQAELDAGGGACESTLAT